MRRGRDFPCGGAGTENRPRGAFRRRKDHDGQSDGPFLRCHGGRHHPWRCGYPQGIDTVIGTKGTYLSGGEQQRISIARAFLKDAPIILLDEATASLDVENETFIQESLSRLVKDKTVIIIAHRMRTVAGADKIVVLKEGKVDECGSPSELTASGGFYKRMQDLQRNALEWNI
jgi:ATP-binding cassette subfamily B protein